MDRDCLYSHEQGAAPRAMLKKDFLVVLVDSQRFVAPAAGMVNESMAYRASFRVVRSFHHRHFKPRPIRDRV